MYSNTHLDGHSFDYLAKPKNLLIGYLIVLIFFAIYLLAGLFNPLFIYPVILVYGLAAPWMIYNAFRFQAKNTAYRNVRFKFCGNLGDSYVTFLVWASLIPFTFGFILPYWEVKKKEYFFDNLQFGKTSISNLRLRSTINATFCFSPSELGFISFSYSWS